MYDGGWESNLPNGYGSFRDANGNTYAGMWADGFKSGEGKFVHKTTGNTIVGIWYGADGTSKGLEKCNGGTEYHGEFLEEVRHGRGKLISSNGEVYEGEFHYGLK
jgi:hypothetical protein